MGSPAQRHRHLVQTLYLSWAGMCQAVEAAIEDGDLDKARRILANGQAVCEVGLLEIDGLSNSALKLVENGGA